MSTAASPQRAQLVVEPVSSLDDAAVALRRDYAHLQAEAARLERAVRRLRWKGPGADQWRADVALALRSAEDIAVELRKAAWRTEQLAGPRVLMLTGTAQLGSAPVPAAAGSSR